MSGPYFMHRRSDIEPNWPYFYWTFYRLFTLIVRPNSTRIDQPYVKLTSQKNITMLLKVNILRCPRYTFRSLVFTISMSPRTNTQLFSVLGSKHSQMQVKIINMICIISYHAHNSVQTNQLWSQMSIRVAVMVFPFFAHQKKKKSFALCFCTISETGGFRKPLLFGIHRARVVVPWHDSPEQAIRRKVKTVVLNF
jgi:hypothetical protein